MIGLGNCDVHGVLTVVVRVAVRIVPLRHKNVGNVCRLVAAGNLWLRPVGWPRRTRATAVASRTVRGFHRSHHPIGERAAGLDERLYRVGYYIARSENVALDGIENVGARNLALHVLRDVAVGQSRVSSAPALQIQDSELPALKCRVRAQQLDDCLRIRSLLKLLENQHLILMCVVDRRLTCGHAFAGHYNGLDALQKLIVVVNAGGRGDHNAARAAIDGNHRPRRKCRGL